MRPTPLVLLAALGLFAGSAPALTGGGTSPIPPATITTVNLPVAGQRALATSSIAQRFSLVGLHWRGSGSVRFRTRSVFGRWSTWHRAAPEVDGPDQQSLEARATAGWKLGSPWWVGPSDRIETQTLGTVSRLRAFLVWSPDFSLAERAPAARGAPPIVPRSAWGADESIRRASPSYAPSVRFAIVHHTAGQNDYTRAEAPAIVRAVELYDVKGNGWNDIGYNFLVDRFGTIYEGRYGGIERNVVGAHALGFNTGSVGVAVLGSFGAAPPPKTAQDALVRLLAWRLDVAHVNPLGLVTVISGGSERYPKGVPVTLRTVSGHRDTGFTECPGSALYARLDAIAAAAAVYGGPKIYSPQVSVDEVGARFRATLSSAIPWVVTITDGAGATVARGTGSGTAVDWIWDASAVPAGTYSWSIRAGTALPATGKLKAGGAPVALGIEAPSAEPAAISPNGDQQADATLVSFSLSIPAYVTVEVVSEQGDVVATPVDRSFMSSGLQEVVIDGTPLADGRYTIRITAVTEAAEAQSVLPLVVSRTLGNVSITPALFSPNGDGRLDSLTIGYSLSSPAQVRIRIVRDGRWVATPFVGSELAGLEQFTWNGLRQGGRRIADGAYAAIVDATDAVGTVSIAQPFVSDTTAPRVRILPGRPLRIEVSEPATLALVVRGVSQRRVVKTAGIAVFPWPGPAVRVRVVAWDSAGNESTPVTRVTTSGSGRASQ